MTRGVESLGFRANSLVGIGVVAQHVSEMLAVVHYAPLITEAVRSGIKPTKGPLFLGRLGTSQPDESQRRP